MSKIYFGLDKFSESEQLDVARRVNKAIDLASITRRDFKITAQGVEDYLIIEGNEVEELAYHLERRCRLPAGSVNERESEAYAALGGSWGHERGFANDSRTKREVRVLDLMEYVANKMYGEKDGE